MKKTRNLIAVFVAATVLSASAQTTNSIDTQMRDNIKQVEAKIAKNLSTEADYRAEIMEFDRLYALAETNNTNEQAPLILYMKAKLYLQIIHDYEKALGSFSLVAEKYPQTKYGIDSARVLKPLAQKTASEKIQAALAIGAPFPDFNEKDLDGKPISVGALKGKVVLVDFWASWCVPCQIEMPNVTAAYNQSHASGFEVIGVTLDVYRPQLDAFLKKKKKEMPWPEYFDENVSKLEGQYDAQELPFHNKLAVKYGIEGIPANFLIDREGKIIGKNLRGKDLEAAVAAALAKK